MPIDIPFIGARSAVWIAGDLPKTLVGALRESLFLRIVLASSLILVLLGGVLTQFLLWRIEAAVVEEAVRDVMMGVRPRLLKMISAEDLAQPIRGESYAVLDELVRDYVLSPEIARLKLWSPAAAVVYSTLPGQIGQSNPGHRELRQALDGKTAWGVTEAPHRFLEQGSEALIEVYIPLAWHEGEMPAGALEVYLWYEPYARHMAVIRGTLLLVVGLVALTLLISLYLLYRNRWTAIVRERDKLAASEERERMARTQLTSAFDGVLLFLSRLLDEKEGQTLGHSRRVASLALACATELGLSARERELARLGGLLHDVGKLGVETRMLIKPGPLSPKEMTEIRRHPLVGERILSGTPYLEEVATIVRSHHERWDGGGYPDGLVGEAIPSLARIVTVCDAYEAMTAERPYRPAKAASEALAEVKTLAGSQFDPLVVEALSTVLAAGRPGADLRLSPGMEATNLVQPGLLAGYDPLSLYRTIFGEMDIAILVLSLDFRVVVANRSLGQLLGLDEKEMLGRHCYDFAPLLRCAGSEDQTLCADCPETSAMQSGNTVADVRFINGILRSYKAVPIHGDRGSVEGVLLVLDDVSEQMSDPLTGAFNYRLFQESLETEWARARRYGRVFSLLMIDVDGFKAVNDQWGHPYGDQVLRRLAGTLRGSLRRGDILFRTGGDEFAIIAPETNRKGALMEGQRLSDVIRNTFQMERLSVSWGTATVPDDGLDLTPAEIYTLADRRLYDKKAVA